MSQTPPDAVRIDLPRPSASYLEAVGAEWPAALARAITSSRAWTAMLGAKLLVVEGEDPHLVAVGRFDAAGRARLAALQTLVETQLPALVYLNYAEVERAVQELGDRLRAELGAEALASASFVGVPRGGLIVLGMLAYALGLGAKQLSPAEGRPLVVVDDIVISGNRMLRWLAEHEPGAPVVLASLFSAPPLRRAALEDPRVAAVVSARDLTDRTPAVGSAEHAAWTGRWRSREPNVKSWFVGQTEHVCFPWNEPDIAMWNPVLERVERAWRLMPPELCLKHRAGGGS
ncbi:MAG TPA: hypothetical protein VF164_05200 [Trueperaceae bacterium]